MFSCSNFENKRVLRILTDDSAYTTSSSDDPKSIIKITNKRKKKHLSMSSPWTILDLYNRFVQIIRPEALKMQPTFLEFEAIVTKYPEISFVFILFSRNIVKPS